MIIISRFIFAVFKLLFIGHFFGIFLRRSLCCTFQLSTIVSSQTVLRFSWSFLGYDFLIISDLMFANNNNFILIMTIILVIMTMLGIEIYFVFCTCILERAKPLCNSPCLNWEVTTTSVGIGGVRFSGYFRFGIAQALLSLYKRFSFSVSHLFLCV